MAYEKSRQSDEVIMSNQSVKKIPTFKAFEIVNKLTLFDELSPEEKRLISNNQTIFTFIPKDDVFITEGEIESNFYLLLNGTARVKHQNFTYDELIAGDVVGICGFLRDTPRLGSVIATSDILAIKYSRFHFKRLPAKVRETIKDHMLEELAKRIDRINKSFHQKLT